jgi:hypothetical protein
MVVSLVFALTMLSGGGQQSTFKRLFPTPTGANGYEEFARADDLMRELQIGIYQSWLPPERRPKPEPETKEQKEARAKDEEIFGKPDPKIEALRQRLNEMNQIQVRAEESRVGAPIIALIRQGLQKPISRPQSGDATEFVSLSQLRRVGYLLADSAYVEFAGGRPSMGYEHLRTALLLGDALSPYGTIDLLIGTATSTRTLAAFNEHFDQIPLAELQQIPSLCQTLLRQNRLLQSWTREQANARRTVAESVKDFLTVTDVEDIGDSTIQTLVREFSKMSAAQKNAFRAEVERRVREEYTRAIGTFRRNESEWIAEFEKESDDERPIKSLADAIDEFVSWLAPPSPRTVTTSYVRYRTQVRLLDLHSRVRAFRWVHGRLPATLTEAGVVNTMDPLSKEAFQYEIQGERAYRLYSKGNSETGEVELKYVRPRSTPINDDP